MPLAALAQTTAAPCTNCNLGYTPLEPIPGLTTNADGSTFTNPNNLPSIVNAIFKIFITVGALFAVLMLTVGGIQYMISGGPAEKARGIQRAQAALWGILLLAAAYLILYTINPNLLTFNLNPCPSGSAGCAVTGTVANNNANSGSAAACGTYYPNGCAAGSYCGSINGIAGNCIPNTDQAAQTGCSGQGGTWTTDGTGSYCYLSNQTTKDSCESQSVGGKWTTGWFSSPYCRK